MNKLYEILNKKRELEEALERAKREALITVVATIADNDGCFATDIAEAANLPTCAVIGVLQSGTKRGDLVARREVMTKTYVRLNDDGTINRNDILCRKYIANKYTIR